MRKAIDFTLQSLVSQKSKTLEAENHREQQKTTEASVADSEVDASTTTSSTEVSKILFNDLIIVDVIQT